MSEISKELKKHPSRIDLNFEANIVRTTIEQLLFDNPNCSNNQELEITIKVLKQYFQSH
jgi:hypothetical protein